MKKFKTKKRFKNGIIYVGIFLITISLTIKYLYDQNLINNNTIVKHLISDNLGNFKHTINDVDFLLKYALNMELDNNKFVLEGKDLLLNSGDIEVEKEEVEENNILDDSPIVYIYNTHQEEKYASSSIENYNISPDVLLAARMLKEYLKEEGIIALVEESNVTQRLRELGLNYNGSYKVSREFMTNAKKNNQTLEYFIDLHRDAGTHDSTTSVIDGESYAKLLLVVGLDNKNYEPNLKMAEKIKTYIEGWNPSLFRGIMKKSGKGVNGVYNQDFSEKTMLIEVGGQNNTISEVNNTLQVLAHLLAEFIKENKNE